jgi:hypothetical protein
MNEMRTIDGQGWFIFTVTRLASGGDPRDEHQYNPYASAKECAYSPMDWRVAKVVSRALAKTLDVFQATGVARYSRRGWLVIDHPVVGQITWKSGVDFRTAKDYLFLRVGGKTILAYWPELPHQTDNRWYFPALPPEPE